MKNLYGIYFESLLPKRPERVKARENDPSSFYIFSVIWRTLSKSWLVI